MDSPHKEFGRAPQGPGAHELSKVTERPKAMTGPEAHLGTGLAFMGLDVHANVPPGDMPKLQTVPARPIFCPSGP
eukprot:2833343-Alexandrium_andersonii.AAC.1